MKNQNKQCKIIQDLLPTYIEKLTSQETNEYIEEHIAKCPECKQVLKDMQGDIELEIIDKNVEIKGLKKVKNRLRLQILFSIIIVVILFSVGIYFNNNFSIYTNSEGKLAIKHTTQKPVDSNSKYLIIKAKKKTEGTIDGYAYITQIITLNIDNLCTNMRCIEEGYTDDELNNLYNRFQETSLQKVHSNIEIKNRKIYYNFKDDNGKYKDEIIEGIKNYYNEIEYINEI